MVHSSPSKVVDPNSIDKEASRAFRKVKIDIEELRRLINTKQDKQTNVLIEMNNMKSELKIEFREELLELQKSMTQEIDALRKEVLYYRELCEQHRMDHHKIKVVEESSRAVHKVEEPTQGFVYERVEPQSEEVKTEYKPTPQSQNFEEVREHKKTYLNWITVGDKDLDSIDEVIVKWKQEKYFCSFCF